MADKILIVEDELHIARMIRLELEREGYLCSCAHDGEAGLEAALSGEYDLVLLDIMLPKLDGLTVLQRLRQRSEVRVIMLTALGEIDDRVKGLDLGADDYLTKPFAMRELVARVRAALRHRASAGEETELSAGELRADRLAFRAFYGKEELTLTRKEFELLVFFMEHPDVVCSREQILREVWGYDYVGDTNLIDVYIRYLRTKIDDRFGVHYFRTVRGLGYAFGTGHE
ncbi:MAG: response regulator transcription factor [Clostridia bacterium]|nr:response regulator transcription factor [Clostridia bacterium]